MGVVVEAVEEKGFPELELFSSNLKKMSQVVV